MRKRMLATVLALCMVLGMLPGTALGAEEETTVLAPVEDAQEPDSDVLPGDEDTPVEPDLTEIPDETDETEERTEDPEPEDSEPVEPAEPSTADAPVGYEPVYSADDAGSSPYGEARPNADGKVLLIQTTIPWNSNANSTVLNSLIKDGYLESFKTVSMANATSVDFTDYDVIMMANDQTANSYGQYERIRVDLEEYAFNGGVVLFGACDNGWASGKFTASLPSNVKKYQDMSDYNYIADSSSPVVTGELTDGKALTNDMLRNHYCSHTSFVEDSLPEGANVILRSKNTNAPTLVEYPYGSGQIILSGLTWEHAYQYYGVYSYVQYFSRNSYDDLIVYALTKSKGHSPNITAYDFNYNQNEKYSDLAELTSLYALLAYRESVNRSGKWVANGSVAKGTMKQSDESRAALGKELQKAHFTDLYSYNYDNPGVQYGGITSKKCDKGEHSICYTIGHRRVSINGSIQDQIVVVFRGTSGAEWYGNFDVSGVTYDSDKTHRSFLTATESALTSLGEYISEFSNQLSAEDGLSILVTGHSRGAAVANLFAHSLNENPNRYNGKTVASVYAYTYATPNVAAYDKIKESPEEQNIFNFCFTDDFVPNLPLESWTWGKYGRTYWATADDLDYTSMRSVSPVVRFVAPIIIYPPQTSQPVDSAFRAGTKAFYGESPNYNTNHTKAIVKSMNKLASSIKNYYDASHIYNYKTEYISPNPMLSPVMVIVPDKYMTSYQYMRDGVGGAMQGVDAGTKVISGSLITGDFSTLSRHFATGGMVGFKDWKYDPTELIFTGELNYTHQAGSYYVGMDRCFDKFNYSQFNPSGYDATPYAMLGNGELNAERAASLDDAELAAIKSFLNDYTFEFTDSAGTTATINNAVILGWDLEDLSTWEGITIEDGHVTAIDLPGRYLHGQWNLSGFSRLRAVNVDSNFLTALNFSGCSALEQVECGGNKLEKLDLTGCAALTYLDCEQNQLKELDLSDCANISSLFCNCNYLTEIMIPRDVNDLTSISYENQSTPADAVFSDNDVEKLSALAAQGGNNAVLQWNMNAPETWNEVKWVPVAGVYYANEIDLRSLELSGTVDLSNCQYLEILLVSDNDFTGLNVEGCDILKTLWCDNNNLPAVDLDRVPEGIENTILTPQKIDASQLSASDVAALTKLVNAKKLDWDVSNPGNNSALTWTAKNDVYVLTGIDFAGTGITDSVDLSDFTSLKTVGAANTGIRSITLPASVTAIDDYAFFDCTNLTMVTFLGDAPSIAPDAFAGCKKNLTLRLLFDVSDISLSTGEQYQLGTSHFPAGSKIVWGSSSVSTATVSNTGLITVVSDTDGSTTLITASASRDTYTFTAVCTVTVGEHRTGFRIHFDANGGTGVMADRTVGENAEFILPDCAFTAPSGKEFKAWLINGVEYTPGMAYTVVANTTVTAVWQDSIDNPPVPPVDEETFYISIPQFANGSITPTTRSAAPGERVTLYAHPDAGYELDSLTVRDSHGRNIALRGLGEDAYSFIMPAARVKVEAVFTEITGEDNNQSSNPAEDEPFTGLGTPGISGIVLNPAVMPFTDVKANDWFYDNVDYVWKHYLMSGVSDTQFAPNVTTSRAMIWTILARMNNVRTDINPGSIWYERGLLWAQEQGVTDGTNPMGDITREQLATMLWRNAGRPAPGAAADLSRFSDAGSVSGYAQTAVRWAASVGVLNGSDGKIDPQGTATRAQVAAMVARYGDRVA